MIQGVNVVRGRKEWRDVNERSLNKGVRRVLSIFRRKEEIPCQQRFSVSFFRSYKFIQRLGCTTHLNAPPFCYAPERVVRIGQIFIVLD